MTVHYIHLTRLKYPTDVNGSTPQLGKLRFIGTGSRTCTVTFAGHALPRVTEAEEVTISEDVPEMPEVAPQAQKLQLNSQPKQQQLQPKQQQQQQHVQQQQQPQQFLIPIVQAPTTQFGFLHQVIDNYPKEIKNI